MHSAKANKGQLYCVVVLPVVVLPVVVLVVVVLVVVLLLLLLQLVDGGGEMPKEQKPRSVSVEWFLGYQLHQIITVLC